jgi:hypothetical protein
VEIISTAEALSLSSLVRSVFPELHFSLLVVPGVEALAM